MASMAVASEACALLGDRAKCRAFGEGFFRAYTTTWSALRGRLLWEESLRREFRAYEVEELFWSLIQ